MERICTTCKTTFSSLIEEYLNCVYCWYDSYYGRSLVRDYKIRRNSTGE